MEGEKGYVLVETGWSILSPARGDGQPSSHSLNPSSTGRSSHHIFAQDA